MRYGLIGEHLGHSFSARIHAEIGGYEYILRELSPDALDEFMRERDFLGINVTIPYKRDVIKYLDEIDDAAEKIGAVNTVVNRGGKLFGYNTDFGGMKGLIQKLGIHINGKKVLVLGTGGTSRTAMAVAESLGAASILRVSRTGREDSVTYEEAYRDNGDADVIINATPCGMFPELGGIPADIGKFPSLSGIVDVIYNPLRSGLVLGALERGISAGGGLYMLVTQALLASSYFTGREYTEAQAERIYSHLLAEKTNIVLTGMPGSGKTTVGRLIAETAGRSFADTDELIEKKCGMTVSKIFGRFGEDYFRQREAEVITELAARTGIVIATGGGAVLRSDNVRELKRNGRLFFLDRPPEQLVPTSDRPLASDVEAIMKRYRERIDIYRVTADEIISGAVEAQTAAHEIEGRIFG